MKKKLVALVLALALCLALLPVTAGAAAVGNYVESNVTWIGTQAEYQKTLDGFFQHGVRKVKAGDKWGIVDAAGEFVAAPIYDSIGPQYLVPTDELGNEDVTPSFPKEELFVDGYTQATRGGKMGLLNEYGEEVIPAKYYAVGLPSEGICRVTVQSGENYYLGYWSLALGREIVAPNKYVVSKSAASAKGAVLVRQMVDTNSTTAGLGGSHNPDAGADGIDYEEVSLSASGRLAAQHDFNDGYAFVATGKREDASHYYGTILDKTGKEILPGGPYLYRTGTYPQFGPYLVFCKRSDKSYSSDFGDLGRVYLSGVVGPKGVVIPAQYHGGIRKPITGAYVGDARMTVLPELGLVITAKDTTPGKENGGKVGVVNFKNQTVIPFTHDFNYFRYDPAAKVFLGMSSQGDRIYSATGKRLNSSDYTQLGTDGNYQSINGYARATRDVPNPKAGSSDYSECFVNLQTGKEHLSRIVITGGKNTAAADAYGNPSATGLVWVKNEAGKIGLLNMDGKVILPYQYDKVEEGDHWTRANGGYAVVYIGKAQGVVSAAGKQVLPCAYTDIDTRGVRGPSSARYVAASTETGTGLYSLTTGQAIIPTQYASIGGFDVLSYACEDFALSAQPVKLGDGYLLVDSSGNPIAGTERARIYTPQRGLYSTDTRDYLGPEGKVVFPGSLYYSGRPNSVLDDMTLVVRNGQVGYISADHLAKPAAAKTMSPNTATATASSMKLLVGGKPVAVEAYNIGGSNYIKIRDMAYFVNGTEKNFQVTWNAGKNAIELKAGTTYTPVAGDMAKGDGKAKTATRSSSAIYVDGLQRKLTAYTIGGNNFFKLRDVMRVFNIYVGYENGTVTVDPSLGYEAAASEQITPPSGYVEPHKTRNVLQITKLPVTEYYMTKNHTFDTTGMVVTYYNDDGEAYVVPVSELVITADGNVITDGYVFKTSSIKAATVQYNGLSADFRIFVYQGKPEVEIDKAPGQTDQQLPDGKYTITCMGNNLSQSNGWIILDNSPTKTVFTVKREGDYYRFYLYGTTKDTQLGTDYMNGQLVRGTGKWTITHLGGNDYSMRVYEKPEMLVNAAGESNQNGTKVLIWKHTNMPKNGYLTFTAVP